MRFLMVRRNHEISNFQIDVLLVQLFLLFLVDHPVDLIRSRLIPRLMPTHNLLNIIFLPIIVLLRNIRCALLLHHDAFSLIFLVNNRSRLVLRQALVLEGVGLEVHVAVQNLEVIFVHFIKPVDVGRVLGTHVGVSDFFVLVAGPESHLLRALGWSGVDEFDALLGINHAVVMGN